MARFGRAEGAARRMGTSGKNARGILIRRMQRERGRRAGQKRELPGWMGRAGGGQRADAGRGPFSEYETGPESANCEAKENVSRREVTSRFTHGFAFAIDEIDSPSPRTIVSVVLPLLMVTGSILRHRGRFRRR